MSGRPPRRTLAELPRDHAHAQHPIDAENAALARDQTDLAIRRVDEADRPTTVFVRLDSSVRVT